VVNLHYGPILAQLPLLADGSPSASAANRPRRSTCR